MPIRILTDLSDALKGSALDDVLSGLGGDDRISGEGGSDKIDGGEGHDMLYGDFGEDTSTPTNATPLVLDLKNLDSQSGHADRAEVGDWAIYRDVATLDDGTNVWGRLVLTGKSDPNMRVDLSGHDNGGEILMNGAGRGDSAEFRLEFFDPATGDPVTLTSIATFNDIDRSGNGDQEAIILDKDSFTSYAAAENTSLDIETIDDVIRAGGTENNRATDEDAWFSAGFEDRSDITFSIQTRDGDSGFTLSGDMISGATVTDIDQGDDTLLGGDGDDTAYGGGGHDLLEGGLGVDLLLGGSGNDGLFGGDGDDILLGGIGHDTMLGGLGNDLLDGGDGNDLMRTGLGNDTLLGGAGQDTLTNSAGDDSLDGGEGDDLILATAGDDTLIGGSGDDTLEGGVDNDRLDGGDGHDVLEGGDGDDTLAGGEGDDLLYGGSGNDLMTTGLGNDTLYGGAGDDTLRNSAGDDSLDGGDGHDVIVATEGDDTLVGGAGDDSLEGGVDNDFLDGGTGDDTLSGGDGDDTLSGGEGQDSLEGGDGRDLLSGGAGRDILDGGSGHDTLAGGAGDDTLTGGAGKDHFVLDDGGGGDRVTDFDHRDDDDDGFMNDQIDVGALSGGSGPEGSVTAWDVVVEDDGEGNARLVFPEGETLVLEGVAPEQMASAGQLFAAGIPCFTPGTLIDTPSGEIPVEDLQPGDKVVTLDAGPQPLLWTARQVYTAQDLAEDPARRPVRLAEGLFGNPEPLLLSPQHAMLLDGTLVRARQLTRVWGAPWAVQEPACGITYLHLLTPRHALVRAHGAWSETLYPGPYALRALSVAARMDLIRHVPELAPIVLSKAPAEEVRTEVAALYGPPVRPYRARKDIGAPPPLRMWHPRGGWVKAA